MVTGAHELQRHRHPTESCADDDYSHILSLVPHPLMRWGCDDQSTNGIGRPVPKVVAALRPLVSFFVAVARVPVGWRWCWSILRLRWLHCGCSSCGALGFAGWFGMTNLRLLNTRSCQSGTPTACIAIDSRARSRLILIDREALADLWRAGASVISASSALAGADSPSSDHGFVAVAIYENPGVARGFAAWIGLGSAGGDDC